jgi:5-oxoprolinase (ATP-hydrolysing) subunit B
VPADGSLLVVLKAGATIPTRLRDLLSSHPYDIALADARSHHDINVIFDGMDLPLVAERLGWPRSSLVEGLCAISFVVKFLGCQPGFAYLQGLPVAWHLPRQATPRKAVPAGSVAIGGAYCGIYPAARFQPGDTVRLIAT